jgi:hypothetical protein
MKSAYELAMERLEKKKPARQLNDYQKAQMAELDNQAEARIAGVNLNFDAKIATANPMEAEELGIEKHHEIARIEEKRDADKDALWNQG